MTIKTDASYDRDDAERAAQWISEILGYDPVSVEPMTHGSRGPGWHIEGLVEGGRDFMVRVTLWENGIVFGTPWVLGSLREAEILAPPVYLVTAVDTSNGASYIKVVAADSPEDASVMVQLDGFRVDAVEVGS